MLVPRRLVMHARAALCVAGIGCGPGRDGAAAASADPSRAPTSDPWPTPGWAVVAQQERERCAARNAAFQPGTPEPIAARPLAGTLHGEPFRFATALAYRHHRGQGVSLVLYDAPRVCETDEPRGYAGHDIVVRIDAFAPAPPRRLNPTDVAVRYPFSIAYRPVASCEPTQAAIEIIDAAGARGRARLRIEWGEERIEGEVDVSVCP